MNKKVVKRKTGSMAAVGPSLAKQPSRRKPGRPPTTVASAMSKERIITTALRLCRESSLQEVSIVRMAQEMGATPGLMHYYLGTRDALTSGVMNDYYKQLVAILPSHTGDWRADLEALIRRIYANYVEYSGITAYLMTHNRYRLLQDVEEGQVDYGSLFFDRFISCVRQAGLDASRTAVFAHLLLQHVLASAYQQVRHQLPGDHQSFLASRMHELAHLPNIRFVADSFSELTGSEAFEAGLAIILASIEREIPAADTRRPEKLTVAKRGRAA